jgi:uncharacterized phage protein gp47/JayE
MEFLTRLDFHQIGRDYVRQRAKRLDPALVDVEGSNVNVLVGSAAFMAQAISRQNAESVRARSIEADGEDLDRWCMETYQTARKGASPAVVPVQLTRPNFAAGAGDVPVGTKLLSRGGVEYVTTTLGTFGATQVTGVEVDARAVQAGFTYQVGANSIVRFANPGELFDPNIVPNNAQRAAGGSDREQDGPYRERARNAFLAARRGIAAAIEFGALSTPGVESAVATEELVGDAPARIVTLLCADSAGACNRVLAERVRVQLREYRAAGISVVVLSSSPQIVSVVLALTFSGNVDTVQLTSDVRRAVVNYANGLGAGRPLLRGDLFAVLSRFRRYGLVVTRGAVVEPAGDLYPDAGRTLRTRPENVTTV